MIKGAINVVRFHLAAPDFVAFFLKVTQLRMHHASVRCAIHAFDAPFMVFFFPSDNITY